jgi:molecular chaperone Hsp33
MSRSDGYDATPRPAELVRTVSEAGGIAARAIIGSNLIAHAISIREMAPTAANALGRLLMGTVLIAVGSSDGRSRDDAPLEDEGETVQIQLRGDGPLGGVVAISDSLGRVRGTVSRPYTNPTHSDGSPDVARAIGLGSLTVVRHRPGWREPFSGTVPLTSGEIAQDITLYLSESEQTPSAMGLGVAMTVDESAVVGGGFLVQLLPDASHEEVARLEANVHSMPTLSDLLLCDSNCHEMLDLLLDGLGSRTRHSSQPIFHCPCTRERALRTLSLLEHAELEELVRESRSQEVCCHFCGRAYELTPDEIEALASRI